MQFVHNLFVKLINCIIFVIVIFVVNVLDLLFASSEVVYCWLCAWFNADERCVTLPTEPLPQKWYFEQF